MFLITIYFLVFKSNIQLIHSFRRLNPKFATLLLIAGNLVLRTLTLNIALILTHKFANIYGTVQAATHAVLLNLWLFSAFFLDAFATAANAMAGRFLGAHDTAAMQRNLDRNLGLGLGVSIILALVLLLFDKTIMGMLVDNEKVWSAYPMVLPLFALCLPINATAFVLDGVFKGMGKAKFLRNVLFISTFAGFMPVLFIGHFYMPGLKIIWWSIITWMVLRSLIPFFYFRFWIKRFD
jgi:Na+-driven multidrug efflux pump